ncbi:tail fiber domain-containing protein [Flavobacterium yafengii]|uniref:Tail fiber domain-containing protein n=1 Tax=Flavobacterium yafengii TaxID=3041253 RepID=A0AAW6TNK8_9FLAO|nr:tail fiber domain-containing protein [Flavobacterium yafengii]MDI5950339.1 tail fiber domain-containing protein [Flavobacterium yafengii]
MRNADSQWANISGSTTAGGTEADMPTGGKPGDLFFNTDLNILYVFDANSNWVEVSTNGSTPSGTVNPDPITISVKEGALFYNTSDHRLYVYNGTVWMPMDNSLPSGRIFVGNSSNVAVPVLLFGDATMSSNGNLTIKNSAVTEAKLDKTGITLDGFANPANNVSLGDGMINHKIINLANPSSGTDATNKSYVDGLFTSPTLLALPNNSLFVGNASNRAAAVSKSLVPISGFANAIANISLGNGITNYKIVNLLDPTLAQDAATKFYVDTKTFNPANISLPTGNLLIGSSINNASAVAKNTISLSGFAAATADIDLGNKKIVNLAEPTIATDAATKNYVDTKDIAPADISLTSGNLFVGDGTGKASDVSKSTIALSGFAAATADIDLGTKKIANLADPVVSTDAATKKYVDDLFITPVSMLSLPNGNLFVGNATGKAAASPKNLIPISGFGTATDDISMGDIGTQFRISFLAEPIFDQDAVTKYYVDTRTATPAYLDLAADYVLVGDLSNKATSVPKSAIPLSDLGAAIADISIGGFKMNNLAEPASAADAATKNYVDNKVIVPTNISLTSGNLFVGDFTGKASDVSKSTIALSGFAPATADIDLGTKKIVNLAEPAVNQDAATKSYVDNKIIAPTNISLTSGNLFVGDVTGKASDVSKSTISLSGFAAATADIDLGTKKIVNLAEPTIATDAATKNYVDTKDIAPADISLTSGNLFVGDGTGKASDVSKSTIALSGFAAATADIDLGTKKIANLADPVVSTDAATKNYVDTRVITPTNISLTSGNLFVGDGTGKASDVSKSTISLSGFAAATADIDLGTKKIVNLAEPTIAADAATKNYVDNRVVAPTNISLTSGNFFVGDVTGKASDVSKSTIALSGFAAATADIDLGTKKIVNLAEPAVNQDAATKNYVDNKIIAPTNISLTSGNLFVGDGTGKASDVSKSTITLSGFAAATADIDLGIKKIVNLADPVVSTDAVTKNYVDTKVIFPADISLTSGNLFVGDGTGKAADVSKSTISLSGFAAATADIDLGAKKIVNLAEPTIAADAATKNYVDNRVVAPTNISLTSGNFFVGDVTGKASDVSKSTIALSGFAAATADIDLGTKKIVNLAEPAVNQDAATKNYVDNKIIAPTNISLTSGNLFVGDGTGKASDVSKSTIALSGFAAATADIDLGIKKIVNLADPVVSTDAVTKNYVDTKVIFPADISLTSGNLFVGDGTGKAADVSKSTISLSGFAAATADIDLGAKKIVNLAEPTIAADAATKNYVDSKVVTIASISLADGNLFVGDATGKASSVPKNNILLSGFGVPTEDIFIGGFKLRGLADPSANQDAATKSYVDSKSSKPPVSATAPAAPVTGDMYYNTTDNHLYVFNGTEWVPMDNKLADGQLYIGNAAGTAVSTAKNTIPLSGFGVATADIYVGSGINSYRIRNLAEPENAQDATTRNYVDNRVIGASNIGLSSGNIFLGDGTGKASDVATSTIALSAFGMATTDISLGNGTINHNIVNLADPTFDHQAATKRYVDASMTNATAAGKDNMGNHTATQNIKLAFNFINNDGQNGKGLTFDTAGNTSFGQDVTVNGNFYTPSDNRLKTHIETLLNVLQKIEQIRGVSFEYKDQHKYATGQKIGVIAQELQSVFPEMVTQDKDGFLKVDYTQLAGVLIQAVKEQQKEIDALKTRMDHQQEQINSILKKKD